MTTAAVTHQIILFFCVNIMRKGLRVLPNEFSKLPPFYTFHNRRCTQKAEHISLNNPQTIDNGRKMGYARPLGHLNTWIT
ncbi:hypothetical protein CEXT_446871 [Caerostris extrusa]|uniref:Secreted protein n=1 Tax=Caerostris extrusa TaxID=172846 RepID=A0AAV4RUX7_CAEEX|nr:hypothetical protein CEXT_446871 [Caerostris extrusa]